MQNKMKTAHTLVDSFHRKITYLRVSVTDHCNYRCHYCRDEYHQTLTSRDEILSYEEITRIVRIFSELGVRKVRLTGGEPLLRKDILHLVKLLGGISKITDMPISTNAHLLDKIAHKLKLSGVNRVNISLDSLKQNIFQRITRGGDLQKVISGIDAAIEAGMSPVKLNMVVMKDVNDDEIEQMLDFAVHRGVDMRFIETMPIGLPGIDATTSNHYPEREILKRIKVHFPGQVLRSESKTDDGPARNFTIKNTHSKVGIISAVSHNFCDSCNRVRLTSKGRLVLCLGQENSVSLRDAMRDCKSDEQIKQIIIKAIDNKPKRHEFNTSINNVDTRQMVEIGG